MKTKRNILFTALVLLLAGCEEFSDMTVAERLEGRWEVMEDTQLKDAYEVDIEISPIDSNRILIDNFYGLEAGSIYADISGMTLNVPTQELGNGYTVRGSAIISFGYNRMDWEYDVDDGSGIWMSQTAVYTKVEDY
jgi:hypothetical protein